MIYTARAYKGMVSTPHRLASEAGVAILRKGGNAVEAAVAAAAVLCVVYPHMTGLGGDAVWLIMPAEPAPDRQGPVVIDACGRSALAASRAWYESRGQNDIPVRGPLAALTMAGAVSGWDTALKIASAWPEGQGRGPLGLEELFADAVGLAEQGYPVSAAQSSTTFSMLAQLEQQPGFARNFLLHGKAPGKGRRLMLPALARTLRRLAQEGLNSFYQGSLAREMAEDLAGAGSPLCLDDFQAHAAVVRQPLSVNAFEATLFNSPPPTQGAASLMILALVERLVKKGNCNLHDEASFVHAVVEATKQAFALRDQYLADPEHMSRSGRSLLEDRLLDELAGRISLDQAAPWPLPGGTANAGSDTVWFGVMDQAGNTVSCIQSIYHEFGSGFVLPGSGVLWHNRGLGFCFEEGTANSLGPGKQPFHTLNPAMALFDDGRFMAYGTMGGDGQPQTQAAVFLRYARLSHPLQGAINEPRWLLGRAWGEKSNTLKVERLFPPELVLRLRTLGHEVETVPAFSSLMGHAGALVRHTDGLLEGAFDPRGDGSAGCW